MQGSWGIRGSRSTVAGLGALVLAAVLCLSLLASAAGAARIVGKDGRVYACYKAKGKAKGQVRLVAKRAKCHRGEKKVSWSASSSEQGVAGENGSGGEPGTPGEPGTAGTATLEQRITTLTKKVTGLEEVLQGVTNGGLTGALSKLQGVSGMGLQEAVAKVPAVGALCTQATKLTSQSNAFGGLLEGAKVLGSLLFPSVPVALPSFSCP
jgi:hypothetical protein